MPNINAFLHIHELGFITWATCGRPSIKFGRKNSVLLWSLSKDFKYVSKVFKYVSKDFKYVILHWSRVGQWFCRLTRRLSKINFPPNSDKRTLWFQTKIHELKTIQRWMKFYIKSTSICMVSLVLPFNMYVRIECYNKVCYKCCY